MYLCRHVLILFAKIMPLYSQKMCYFINAFLLAENVLFYKDFYLQKICYFINAFLLTENVLFYKDFYLQKICYFTNASLLTENVLFYKCFFTCRKYAIIYRKSDIGF